MSEVIKENGQEQPDAAVGRRRDPRSRRAVLTATVEILGEVGYRGLTMEGVASRAGVGKATVYRWWSSKGALAVEAMTELLPLEPVPETGDTRRDLRVAIRAAIATLTSLPTSVVIPALAADLLHDPEAAARFREFLRPRRSSVLRLLRRAADRGELPHDADVALMFDIYAGTVFYRALVSGEPVTDDVVDQLVDLLLAGQVPATTARTDPLE